MTIQIRPATAADAATIRRMVREARLDPTSLRWERFLIAEQDGEIVGIGQVKHYPGCYELGSLVVRRDVRRQGVAARLIAALEARAPRPLYLLCRDGLGSFYVQFGYRAIPFGEAPAALKLKLAFAGLFRVFGVRVLVMRKP